ncbi:MAG: uroporphyrinogen decarboxylase family protein, partial [Bacteroidota bacterium]
PVMTGPFDTVNYLLGTTTLMEWVYTEPLVVHGLLDKVTAVIIERPVGTYLHIALLGLATSLIPRQSHRRVCSHTASS